MSYLSSIDYTEQQLEYYHLSMLRGAYAAKNAKLLIICWGVAVCNLKLEEEDVWFADAFLPLYWSYVDKITKKAATA